jgi:hypothetical protein
MRILLLASILVLIAGPVHADATQDALTEIAKCSDVSDPGARLKCFDAAAPRARSALAEMQAKEKRGILDWFGFGRPSKPVTKPEEFGKPAAPFAYTGELDHIAGTVIEFAKNSRGRAVFILDIGHVWVQLDGDSTNVLEPAPGQTMKVTVETGMFGSYNLTIEGRNGLVKVRRVK